MEACPGKEQAGNDTGTWFATVVARQEAAVAIEINSSPVYLAVKVFLDALSRGDSKNMATVK